MRKQREYKTGMKYCIWRWKYIKRNGDSTYLSRLHIVQCPLFAICLHWIQTPDPTLFRHDHPVNFLAIVLRGWYVEERNEKGRLRLIEWWNYMRASRLETHRIKYVGYKTVTLCFMGRHRRDWGFHTEDGWVYWKEYERPS